MTVLDASALVAFLLSEQGADRVEAALPRAALSLVNLTETIGVLSRKGMSLDQAEAAVTAMKSPSLAPNETVAVTAARLCVHPGLSLGDRYCVAQAMAQSASVTTADRAWANLNLPVAVELIR
ncbi:MAG: PIN domain-containing protein [Caulobacterales bacterium]|jgi:PIN domain nuclease of toxin-antitoxin system